MRHNLAWKTCYQMSPGYKQREQHQFGIKQSVSISLQTNCVEPQYYSSASQSFTGPGETIKIHQPRALAGVQSAVAQIQHNYANKPCESTSDTFHAPRGAFDIPHLWPSLLYITAIQFRIVASS